MPGMRIGIIAHGDYCDEGSTYVTKVLDLTDDKDAIVRFVERVEPTGGGDAPECYELVLNQARDLSWTPGVHEGVRAHWRRRAARAGQNPRKLDWRAEVGALGKRAFRCTGCRRSTAATRRPSTRSWRSKSGGFHLSLDQFAYITDMLLAICYKQSWDIKLQAYEAEVVARAA